MKNVVLEKYEEIDYVLIARVKDNGEVHEYVAAWCYNESDKTWGTGTLLQQPVKCSGLHQSEVR